MKAKVYGIDGEAQGEIELPVAFDEPVRLDLIMRALLSEQSRDYQPKGPYPFAGIETSAKYRGRKEAWGSIKNKGISRLPREVLAKGAFGKVKRIPSAVKGRRAHPPKVAKILVENMNAKEYAKALASAIAATADSKLLSRRHALPDRKFPVVLDDKFESVAKTKEAYSILSRFFGADLEDAKSKKRLKSGIRHRRKAQRRSYKKSVLVVASSGSAVLKAARNIAGVDSSSAKGLRVRDLCPGSIPRISIFTKGSLKELEQIGKAKKGA